MQKPGQHAAQRLIGGVLGAPDTARLEDHPRPETVRVVRQDGRREQCRAGERGGRHARVPQPGPPRAVPYRCHDARQQQEDDEERGCEFDRSRDADARTGPAVVLPPRQVPQHQYGQQQVDLPIPQRRPHGLAPDGERRGPPGDRHARVPDEPQGEPDECDEKPEVSGRCQHAHARRVQKRQRREQQCRERRVRRGQTGVGGAQSVEVLARTDRLALRPVDHQIDHRDVGDALRDAEGREGDQAGPDGHRHTQAGAGECDHGHEGRQYRPYRYIPETIW
ncbi:hypothetical protein STSP_67800 [Streptomyces jeddahensis]|uniref:Uncharacterized protein n=1 Tax=Streptomyces jeddahensis TaxID=1716141 RepID=A0A177HH22_9ACTN|nr:hypothetical protein STSP_67800 [Streptomyces jeddahensis]